MANNENQRNKQGGGDMDRQRQNQNQNPNQGQNPNRQGQGHGQGEQKPNVPDPDRDKMGQQPGQKRDMPKPGVTNDEDVEQRELDDEDRITQRQPQQGEKPPIRK